MDSWRRGRGFFTVAGALVNAAPGVGPTKNAPSRMSFAPFGRLGAVNLAAEARKGARDADWRLAMHAPE